MKQKKGVQGFIVDTSVEALFKSIVLLSLDYPDQEMYFAIKGGNMELAVPKGETGDEIIRRLQHFNDRQWPIDEVDKPQQLKLIDPKSTDN